MDRPTLPDEKAVVAHLGRRFGSAFAEMDRILTAALAVAAPENDAWVVRAQKDLKEPMTVRTLQVLLAKAIKTYRSIQILCEHGLGHDAGALLRVLLETALAFAWILKKDSDRRAHLLLVHGIQRKLVQLRERQKTPGLRRSASKAAFAAGNKALGTVSDGLSQSDVDSVRKHWSALGNGLEGVAWNLQSGWPRIYTLVYRDTSSYTHVADMTAHAWIDDDDQMVIRVIPGDWELDRTPKVARLLMFEILARLNKRLKLGFDAQIDRVAPPTAHLGKPRRPKQVKPGS